MAYPKAIYPKRVYGLIKEGLGYSLCSFEVNDQRRIKYIEKEPPELLLIVSKRLSMKAENDVLNGDNFDNDYIFEGIENGELKDVKKN